MKDLTEHTLSSEQVFDGKLLKVYRDVARLPDGSEGIREHVKHPGAVAIVPLFDDGSVLLERQFRYPHHKVFIEVPAGKLEPNEPHLETAKRELLEETGHAADEWQHIGTIHMTIAYTNEAIDLYLAKKLRKAGATQLDAGEFVETLVVPYDRALQMIRDGEITDAKTVTALLLAEKLR